MMDNLKKNALARMVKSIDALKDELSRIRTGRASAGILDHVTVDYFGNQVPVSQAATITVVDARNLLVTPWDKKMVPVIEKAILTSNLGLNPVSAGAALRIPLPSMTEDRRRDLIKQARASAENGRIAVRAVRRDANSELKDALKKKLISEDDERRAQDEIQKITDKNIAEVDKLLAAKEKDLMEI